MLKRLNALHSSTLFQSKFHINFIRKPFRSIEGTDINTYFRAHVKWPIPGVDRETL